MTSESGPTRDATGRFSTSECVGERVVENPRPPASIDCLSTLHHRGHLVGRRVALEGGVAHHVVADRAVTDEEPGVDTEAAVEPVEELAEALPLPVDAGFERGERHALDLGQHRADVVDVGRASSARA